jgi:hypothetical protein
MTNEPLAVRTEAELKRQRLRSIAIALALGFMVILFYAATLINVGRVSVGS